MDIKWLILNKHLLEVIVINNTEFPKQPREEISELGDFKIKPIAKGQFWRINENQNQERAFGLSGKYWDGLASEFYLKLVLSWQNYTFLKLFPPPIPGSNFKRTSDGILMM